MATRDDISVDFQTSPRIIEVEDPSVEVTMQDLVDTLRIVEEAFSLGLAFPKVTNASGKDDLGGGVSVGITTSMQNARLSFEARTTPAETGTVTTGSVSPVAGNITFVDVTADFSAANVQRGSLVINFTDLSVADVFSVDSPTQLTTKTLVNGTTNTYQIGDDYHVFNIIQCNVTGGNLVALDNFDVTIDPILPTAFTQVVRTSSSSATLISQTALEFSTFSGGVVIDTVAGTTGTAYPTGTLEQPCDNLTDALAIANTRGLTTIYVIGALALNTGDFTGFTFTNIQGVATVAVSAGATVTNATFERVGVSGSMDAGVLINLCEIVAPITNFDGGNILNTLLEDSITLAGTSDVNILDCWSSGPGSNPTIDMGGSGVSLAVRNYNGAIILDNKSGADIVSMDINSGRVTLNASVTSGTVILRGIAELFDNSAGATVDSSALINETNIGVAVWDGATADHEVAGSFGAFVQNTLLTVAKFLGLK